MTNQKPQIIFEHTPSANDPVHDKILEMKLRDDTRKMLEQINLSPNATQVRAIADFVVGKTNFATDNKQRDLEIKFANDFAKMTKEIGEKGINSAWWVLQEYLSSFIKTLQK